MTMHADVAVIGSGFSAVALSLNLLDLMPASAQVSLVGPEAGLGRGIAYSTRNEALLLNVPAGRMGLFADRPDHFVAWLKENGLRAGPDDFVPRRVYGDYIADCLQAARRRTGNRPALTVVDTVALGAEATQDGGLLFHLSNGERLSSPFAALCTGAGTRRLPLETVPDATRPFVVDDPWAEAWWERLPMEGDVLLVGTGLTMVDQCLVLAERGFKGRIHAVSRHGLLPQAHLDRRADPVPTMLAPDGGEVSQMLFALRRAAGGVPDWRAVMDGLRPVTQALWKAWSPERRARFLRHASAYWNVHRHRMAPAVAKRIAALRDGGRLIVHRGRLGGLRLEGAGLAADIVGREKTSVAAAMVVNCTGFDRCTVEASPLLSSLAAQGVLCADPRGLGIVVDEGSAVPSGADRPRLYALGPLTAGRHFEITAVPDIRQQALSVARAISAAVACG
ncbi:UNVERIFIED_ORG: FAD/NAD(P)-binding protein [Roseateles sp. XES5]|nr:FAD/NAD(P)-binding protein [Roseateles sp. XES5]